MAKRFTWWGEGGRLVTRRIGIFRLVDAAARATAHGPAEAGREPAAHSGPRASPVVARGRSNIVNRPAVLECVFSVQTTGYAAVWYVLLYDTLSDAVVQHEYLST